VGARVAVAGLVKEFPDGGRALDVVTLCVDEGEIVALVGSNGAGKSTLLRCLVRLIEPTAGEVRIDGVDVLRARGGSLRDVRRRVGFIFQKFHLIPRLSAFHNVLLGALGRAGPLGWWPLTASRADRVFALACLDRVGLVHLAERRVETLSGGEQQRVAIARMLMQRPSVVLADEPVASLDPVAATSVMELLRTVARERSLTVLVALHQLEFARRYADRVVGLQHGRVALDLETSSWREDELRRVYAPLEARAG
jgi:phosphonate transport system ATP-binding protein